MDRLEIAEQFVAAINAHNLERVVALMSADHRFCDSLGNVVEGHELMREGWAAYFGMVPDYHLNITGRFFAADNDAEIVLVGMAHGSYAVDGHTRPNSLWSTPIAIRAVVHNSQIAEWHVYADNEPIREQMRAMSA